LDEPLLNEEGEMFPRQLADWSAAPDRMLLQGELHGLLAEAVAGLPERLRAVFVLRDIEGLSTAEVATVLDLTETNVKVRLHRARLALRERLTPYFAVPGSEPGPDDANQPKAAGQDRALHVTAM
jgi:RNA polymerase sigma-70 factor (ECF subfamily)